jgi:carboxymethylenebutenolidase
MRDDDRLLNVPDLEFGSGIVGVCDICGSRQAVVILARERFRLCVLDFLNKTWLQTDKKPSEPAPIYRSERIMFDTSAVTGRRAPAIVLSPTKVVRHPGVLIVPDIYGITTTVLDAAIRFAHAGFEVIIPDLSKTDGISAAPMMMARGTSRVRGGVATGSKEVVRLVRLCEDAVDALLSREMIDASKIAVFGTSFGASVALAFAAQSTRVGAVALAYPLSVRPATLPTLVTAPVLCVVGSSDRRSASAASQLRSSNGSGRVTFAEIAGAGHHFLSRDLRGFDLTRAEDGWEKIVTFLQARLMPPPPAPPVVPAKSAAPSPPAAA